MDTNNNFNFGDSEFSPSILPKLMHEAQLNLSSSSSSNPYLLPKHTTTATLLPGDAPNSHNQKSSTLFGGAIKSSRGKQKIDIEFIQDKRKRYSTFSKRKNGLIKKAQELSNLTGAEVLLVVASETMQVYSFSTPKFEDTFDSTYGKNMIHACLSQASPADLNTLRNASLGGKTNGHHVGGGREGGVTTAETTNVEKETRQEQRGEPLLEGDNLVEDEGEEEEDHEVQSENNSAEGPPLKRQNQHQLSGQSQLDADTEVHGNTDDEYETNPRKRPRKASSTPSGVSAILPSMTTMTTLVATSYVSTISSHFRERESRELLEVDVEQLQTPSTLMFSACLLPPHPSSHAPLASPHSNCSTPQIVPLNLGLTPPFSSASPSSVTSAASSLCTPSAFPPPPLTGLPMTPSSLLTAPQINLKNHHFNQNHLHHQIQQQNHHSQQQQRIDHHCIVNSTPQLHNSGEVRVPPLPPHCSSASSCSF